jgi:hypothetical protein
MIKGRGSSKMDDIPDGGCKAQQKESSFGSGSSHSECGSSYTNFLLLYVFFFLFFFCLAFSLRLCQIILSTRRAYYSTF